MSHHAESAGPGPKRRPYLGGCDCGAVRYAVELDLAGRDPRTNSVWERSVPPSAFRLLRGQEHVIGYQFSAEDAHHFFCARCQARVFSLRAPEGAASYSVDLKALLGPSAAGAATSSGGRVGREAR
jgi:hypothetical protein